jgi:citrate/tricarballylate utilization protein
MSITTQPQSTPLHANAALAEAERLMIVCNACRYCEGLCAVFPALEMRRTFADNDLNYLANLCHGCGACYYDCQFAPPHEFNVNVPKVLAQVRNDSFRTFVWPRAFAPLFNRNGLWLCIIGAISVTAFIVGFAAARDASTFFAVHTGPGAFYVLMPHTTMALLFAVVFAYALFAMAMSARTFWRSTGKLESRKQPGALWQATRDAGELRYLEGGGIGCYNDDARPTDRRRIHHHLVFYGFFLCFAATCVATLYHYLLQRHAPYPWYDLPVLLGTVGGVGMLIGTTGLFFAKLRRDPEMLDQSRLGMDMAFIVMLFLTSLTGLLLLVLRGTAAMNALLAVHLGVVLGLFFTLPYSKFVHGILRWLALIRYAQEQRSMLASSTGELSATSTGQGGTRP